jgi:alpha-glucosidase
MQQHFQPEVRRTESMKWWQKGIIYQIYPRSFQDSNGDGVGDLPGIESRLDYLAWLGVDAIWISPVYPSPMADFGYDVSNYVDIHPLFGTLADMDRLIAAAHERDLKIILDFVPNHTSSEHPWFLASRASRDNPKRDWYIWHDPAPDGGPPNNWLSRFSGESAWEWDETTGQYYLHSFLVEQPDLNWRNPDVRRTMLDVLRFWFERGVDGFRVDVSYRCMKDSQFRDNPPNPDWRPGMEPFTRLVETYTKNTPEIHQFNRWLRQVADEYPDRVLVGEMYLPLDELVKHCGQDDEFHLPFNFHLIMADWLAGVVRELADRYEALLPQEAWPNWVLGNHDQHRIATRVGPAQARVAMMLLLTLRGTPTVYYGDEISMDDVPIPPDKVQDPWGNLTPGLDLGRDPERTPMQWDATVNAGFCPDGVEPWLPVAGDFQQVNVKVERADPNSMLGLTRRLIDLRRSSPALAAGAYLAVNSPEQVFCYQREHGRERFLVALNFSSAPQPLSLDPGLGQPGQVISTQAVERPVSSLADLTLAADEGLVIKLEVAEGKAS